MPAHCRGCPTSACACRDEPAGGCYVWLDRPDYQPYNFDVCEPTLSTSQAKCDLSSRDASRAFSSTHRADQPDAEVAPRSAHHFAFVGGLHRSGTTPLARAISNHPSVSGFANTGVIEDEGQFLQSVYPIDDAFGGVGTFGFHPAARMTEASPLVARAKDELFPAWSPYWRLEQPVLLEKSPANLIRARFLQAVFPNSSFIFVMRHPVAAVMATLKWRRNVPLHRMIRHWIVCHEMMLEDLPHLRRWMVLRYGDLCRDPAGTCAHVERFLGLGPGIDASRFQTGLNASYFEQWRHGDVVLWRAPDHWKTHLRRWRNLAEVAYIEARYESTIRRFGFSFADELETTPFDLSAAGIDGLAVASGVVRGRQNSEPYAMVEP